jgi:hypothetical protein
MIINAAIKLILKSVSGLDWNNVIAIGKDLLDLDKNKTMEGSSKFTFILEHIVFFGILGSGKSMNVIRVFVELLLYYVRKNPDHFTK